MTLSKPSRDLFEAAAGGGRPDRGDRLRVRAKIDKRLAATGAAAAVGALATKTAAGTAAAGASGFGAIAGAGIAMGTIAKVVVPLVVVGAAITAGAVHVARHPAAATQATQAAPAVSVSLREAPAAAPSVEPRAMPIAVPVPVASSEPVAIPAPVAPPAHVIIPAPVVAAAPIGRMPEGSGRNETIEREPAPPSEVALLEGMNAALARGDAAATLGLASEHARLYPGGTLSEERDGARALALCMVGTTSAAREFLRAHPSSPLAGRLRAVCGSRADSIQEPPAPGQ
jgi:hypothetical protein